jgi:hypothetical protein
VITLTDAQLREYFLYLFGPDDDAPLPVPPCPNPDETTADLIDSPVITEE